MLLVIALLAGLFDFTGISASTFGATNGLFIVLLKYRPMRCLARFPDR
jgi:uncharacterized membrane protein YtjA (UPF0391 family)